MIQLSGLDEIRRSLETCIRDAFDPVEVAKTVPDRSVRFHNSLPVDEDPDEAIAERIATARQWYEQNGDPWFHASVHVISGKTHSEVRLEDDTVFQSELLSRGFRVIEAFAAICAGFSAGTSVDEEMKECWSAGKPDDAMFLNSHAVAVVEHLRDCFREKVMVNLMQQNLCILPHYSPGYTGWKLQDQTPLFKSVKEHGPVKLLDSNGLTPSKSTLAIYGIAPNRHLNDKFQQFWERQAASKPDPAPPTMVTSNVDYAFSNNALEKWKKSRLTLTEASPNQIEASFRVSGSTCTNMGRPLAFVYKVILKQEENGEHTILDLDCNPAPEDAGYQSTCLFLSSEKEFTKKMKELPPFLGNHLSQCLLWTPDSDPAGCLCSKASRHHKWRIVLQTVHYALNSDSPKKTV